MEAETRNCANCKTGFTLEPDDFGFYAKMGVPPPKLCPECRFKRRSVFRNERTLYNRKCARCERSIVAMYNPKSPYVVYCNDCWQSDKWDGFAYGRDYNFNRPFLEQLQELVKVVPKAATYSSPLTGPNINSEYTNFSGGNKDGYLLFNSGPGNDNCAYSRGLINNKDTFDVYFADEVERGYEGVNVHKSSGIAWGQNSTDCVDSYFLLNCVGCLNCFGCVNMRHKSFCFFNQQLTKDEWKRRVSEILGSYTKIQEIQKQFEAHALTFPRRENNNLKNVNCTGNYIFESKNCFSCFELSFCENVNYSFSAKFAKDSYDLLGHGRKSELLLEGVGVGLASKVIGGWWVEVSHDVEYSFATRSSEFCIGCDGVKNAKYTILNKRYDETEYRKIREHIVSELKSLDIYGLFMPPQLALFGYNEAVGQDNFPLTKEEAVAQGFRWQDDIQMTKGKETMQAKDLPDHIKDAEDSIVKEIIACMDCGRNYRIIPAELSFYRRQILPLPRRCFNCRFLDRIKRRGPYKLFDRACAKCGKGIKTNFAPDRPEIVYCEACYQSEVI